MADSKKFYQSKTLWANALAILFGIFEGKGWISTGLSQEAQISALSVMNLMLRVLTKEGVSLK